MLLLYTYSFKLTLLSRPVKLLYRQIPFFKFVTCIVSQASIFQGGGGGWGHSLLILKLESLHVFKFAGLFSLLKALVCVPVLHVVTRKI